MSRGTKPTEPDNTWEKTDMADTLRKECELESETTKKVVEKEIEA